MEKCIPEKDLLCSNVVEKSKRERMFEIIQYSFDHTLTSTARLGLMGWISFTV